jgi:hypothetical protein
MLNDVRAEDKGGMIMLKLFVLRRNLSFALAAGVGGVVLKSPQTSIFVRAVAFFKRLNRITTA